MSKKEMKIKPDDLLNGFVRITAAPSLLWFRPRRIYENEEAKKKIRGGALLILNHVSFFDPVYAMLVVWYRRHHFICTEDLLVNPFMNFFLKHVCLCIPIDKQNFNLDMLNEITDHLEKGRLVSMYPEGHVSKDTGGRMDPFKSGMVLMAMRAEVPIVPVYIAPRRTWHSRIISVIGEPLYVDRVFNKRPNMKEINRIAEILQEREEKLKGIAEEWTEKKYSKS